MENIDLVANMKNVLVIMILSLTDFGVKLMKTWQKHL